MISFKPFSEQHLPLWEQWVELPHVKSVWFIDGYETPDYIHAKIAGNGYDFPFVIYVDDTAIGYIQCSDLYAFRMTHPGDAGIYADEAPGTFCIDLFIADEAYLNKGYGTKIIKQFTQKVIEDFAAKKILIDPAVSNKRAIRCYEKAGYQFVKRANDGVTECYVMQYKTK